MVGRLTTPSSLAAGSFSPSAFMTSVRKFANVVAVVHASSETGDGHTEGHLILTLSEFDAAAMGSCSKSSN